MTAIGPWLKGLPTPSAYSLSDLAGDDAKENRNPQTGRSINKRKRSDAMQEDEQETPRAKRHGIGGSAIPILGDNDSVASSQSSAVEESHKSGRMSPTKQMTRLEDLEEPIIFRGFPPFNDMSTAPAVVDLRAGAQAYADGVGIIGEEAATLLSAIPRSDPPLDELDQRRLSYPWAIDESSRPSIGSTPSLTTIRALVEKAVVTENDRAHETVWNEDVHKLLLALALQTSRHSANLRLSTLKSTRIDPPRLAPAPLPNRVVDYGIMLQESAALKSAFARLKPVPGTTTKSWNHVTQSDCRRYPLAVSVETKAPDKSWTDGKPQLGIWTSAFIQRLGHLKAATTWECIPTIPLVVVQGHEWHLMLVTPQTDGGLTIWSQVSIGCTRTCFDTYKIVAVLHLIFDWAEISWRPWFMSLVATD